MDQTSSIIRWHRAVSSRLLLLTAMIVVCVGVIMPRSTSAQSIPFSDEVIVHQLPLADTADRSSTGTIVVPAYIQDSIWVVNFRQIPCGPAPALDDPRIRYSEVVCGCLRPATWEELHAVMSDCCPTVLFVHGNNTSPAGAIKEGRALYLILKKSAAGQPLRMIIWSWPSERTRNRLRRDMEIKERRADTQAVYIAKWLENIDPATPLSLVGYSFGARSINGAMRRLENTPTMNRGAPVRIAFIAAAMNFTSLFSASPQMPRTSRLDHVFVTRNVNDSALRWFPFLSSFSRRALGQVGPGTRARNVRVIDLSNSVGRTHDFLSYLGSANLRRCLASLAFPDRHVVEMPPDDSTRIDTQDPAPLQ